MRVATLEYMDGLLREMEIPYSYMEWKETPPDTYFVGECLENPSDTLGENGMQATTFILRGFTSSSWLGLESYKEKIERNLMKTAILDDGTGVAVFYESAMLVPTGVPGFKSIKINLKVQEWKVN